MSVLAFASDVEPADIETFGNIATGATLATAPGFGRRGTDLGRVRAEDRFTRLAGEMRMEISASLAAGTRLALDPALRLCSAINGESWGIKLDLRLAFSVLNKPM